MSAAWKLLGRSLRILEGFVRSEGTEPNYLLPQYQSALGTVVHATPMVEALVEAVPSARIVVAASGLAAQVWAGNPHLSLLLQTPNPLTDLRGAVRALRSTRLFDGEPYTTLLTSGNERTRITLAALLSGPSRRVGFAVHGELLHEELHWNPQRSQIDNNLRLVRAAAPNAAVPAGLEPKLYPQNDDSGSMLPPRGPGPRIALATQTSVTQQKSWRRERWVELAKALRERWKAELIFIGTASEVPAIEELRSQLNFPTTSVASRTTIQQLAGVLLACDLGIVLDTGPLHVARAVGLPAVIIAPAWSPAHEWLPVGNPHYRILKNLDMPSPPPAGYMIDEVSVAEALEAAESLLRAGRF